MPQFRVFASHFTYTAYCTAVGLSAWIWVRDNVYEVSGVDGPSMAPTLSPSFHETGRMDRLLMDRLHCRDFRRGDIVSFHAPHRPDQLSVKRVVGMPGDTVLVRAKRWQGSRRVTLPYNHVWVEGDNWRNTVDSNDFGPLPIGLINGKARYIVWPLSRWGKIPDPESFTTYSKVLPAATKPSLPDIYED
ncbi:uncharacterized protein K452DRAFT_236911 [Aplosporella prunicola CBS 121167]|uniref:Mitochondrial inner membrane protease subunit n=1 Tax=Aplosporella prunicola CBS 121167 TaxID=1176127 RepID=A0A6A6B007_9PEZI|nr:uncharacterized protein K452DRAFT_236911 [Aplosporella prunicola CBS 121167]KAF2136763.1 hypothetical protein K452DRAFT_236911 [Aplosporella prunicola CBS 121167]